MAFNRFPCHHLKHNIKDKKSQPLSHFDELEKATEAMQDMKGCYDSLLFAAAAATNGAHVFSESFSEMGDCLVQKIALNHDEQFGQVMLMLGETQIELQKLVTSYRNHIIETITVPSESLMNELHTVEEMKNQCDEKRKVYEYMETKNMEMEKSKRGKWESFSSKQLESAKEEFDAEATSFTSRVKSLKHGQSRSLLTLVTRHHSAQLSFFRKVVKSLESIEPHLKLASQQQHINYHFIGMEDEDEVGLRFGHQSNYQELNSIARNNNTLKSLKPQTASSSKDIKLQSDSGPSTSKTMSAKPSSSVGSPTIVSNVSKSISGPNSRTSSNINELHELPRPPSLINYGCGGTHSGCVGSSKSLMMRSSENSAIRNFVPQIAYPLPTPPVGICISMPLSGSGTATESPFFKPLVVSPGSEESVYTSLSPLLAPR